MQQVWFRATREMVASARSKATIDETPLPIVMRILLNEYQMGNIKLDDSAYKRVTNRRTEDA